MREREFDMLVKLYDLPEIHQPDEVMVNAGIRIVRPMPSDKNRITAWIREQFNDGWACEFEKAMSNTPVSCFIAIDKQRQIVGFACYDATCRGFFGPLGVSEACRGLHIGLELVRKRLELAYHGQYTWEHGVSDDGRVYYSRIELRPPFPGENEIKRLK